MPPLQKTLSPQAVAKLKAKLAATPFDKLSTAQQQTIQSRAGAGTAQTTGPPLGKPTGPPEPRPFFRPHPIKGGPPQPRTRGLPDTPPGRFTPGDQHGPPIVRPPGGIKFGGPGLRGVPNAPQPDSKYPGGKIGPPGVYTPPKGNGVGPATDVKPTGIGSKNPGERLRNLRKKAGLSRYELTHNKALNKQAGVLGVGGGRKRDLSDVKDLVKKLRGSDINHHIHTSVGAKNRLTLKNQKNRGGFRGKGSAYGKPSSSGVTPRNVPGVGGSAVGLGGRNLPGPRHYA